MVLEIVADCFSESVAKEQGSLGRRPYLVTETLHLAVIQTRCALNNTVVQPTDDLAIVK